MLLAVSIDFSSNTNESAPFHRRVFHYSCADCDRLCDHLRDATWGDIFKLVAFATVSKIIGWVQVGIDKCICLVLMALFGELSIGAFKKSKSAILPLFDGLAVLYSVPDQAKLFAEIFSMN